MPNLSNFRAIFVPKNKHFSDQFCKKKVAYKKKSVVDLKTTGSLNSLMWTWNT